SAVGRVRHEVAEVIAPPAELIDLRQLQRQEGEIAQWLAAQREIPAVNLNADLRNMISLHNSELQNVQDQFRQLRGFKNEYLRGASADRAVLEQYQNRLSRIMQKKARVESIYQTIRQQLANQ
ncbi:MAG: hypothetical protein R2911_38930, partial [Caldilineaceae bacterium]